MYCPRQGQYTCKLRTSQGHRADKCTCNPKALKFTHQTIQSATTKQTEISELSQSFARLNHSISPADDQAAQTRARELLASPSSNVYARQEPLSRQMERAQVQSTPYAQLNKDNAHRRDTLDLSRIHTNVTRLSENTNNKRGPSSPLRSVAKRNFQPPEAGRALRSAGPVGEPILPPYPHGSKAYIKHLAR